MNDTSNPYKRVTSISNPRIKSIRSLSRKKNRALTNLFVVEGAKLVMDALSCGWRIDAFLFSPDSFSPDSSGSSDNSESFSHYRTVADEVLGSGGDVLVVSPNILSVLSRRDNANNCIGVIERKHRDLSEVTPSSDDTWVALDRVRDPGNLGTIIRTCEAFGVGGIILVGDCTDPFAIEAVRATMGSLFHVPLYSATESEFELFVSRWRDSFGGRIIGTHLEGSTDHRDIDYKHGANLLLMGNEQQGLPKNLANSCDILARIAMTESADSLNLAIATGIILFESRRHLLGSR